MDKHYIDVNKSDGLFYKTKLDSNDNLVLAPKNYITSLLVDDSIWNRTGSIWESTPDSDKISINNINGDACWLSAIINLEQTETTKSSVTFRVKAKGENITGDSWYGNYGIHMIPTFSDGGMGDGEVHPDIYKAFPNGTFDDLQLSIEYNPSRPIRWIYLYVYARNNPGKITLWDAELIQDNNEKSIFGMWESKPINIENLSSTKIEKNSISLPTMAYKYGDLSNVDNFNSIEYSIDKLSKFDYIIASSPIDKSKEIELSIMDKLISMGKKVFGYLHIGKAASINPLTHTQLIANMDSCKERNLSGIFFDMAGYDYEVNRAYLNTYVDYAHSLNLSVIANAWNQSDILSDEIDSVYNPTGLATSLGYSDGTPIEVKTQIDFNTNISNYVQGATYTIDINSNSYSKFDNIRNNIVLGKSYIDDDYGNKFLTITLINNYKLTVKSEQNYIDYSQASWNGCNIVTESIKTYQDWILLESFYQRSDNKYADEVSDWKSLMNKYINSCALAKEKNVKVCTLGYVNDNIEKLDIKTIDRDSRNVYILSLLLGCSAWSYGSTDLTICNVPKINLGNEFIDDIYELDGNYFRDTDLGTVFYISKDRYSNALKFNMPTSININFDENKVIAKRTNIVFLQSNDKINWEILNTNSLKKYIKIKAVLFNY